jgi:hydrogenase expression/formation protein HypE
MGKLATKDLKKLLTCIKRDSRVLIPPQVGFDAGVHKIGDKYLVVATDPCVGVPEKWFGYLLIHYAASDMALFGAKPQFCTITLMGPRNTRAEKFQEIMKQTCSAADDLGVAIVRGHTGTYESISELVGVCTVYGTAEPEKLKTPANAKPGDLILCTKPIGLETVVNFTLQNEVQARKLFGIKRAKELAKQVQLQSCVKEALQLAELPSVHAMHDATEGGMITALNELAEASHLGFTLNLEKVNVINEAFILQRVFGFSEKQLLAMSSTGTIFASVDSNGKAEALEILHKGGLEPVIIGEFAENKSRILVKNGKEAAFPEAVEDPYSMILSGKA